MTKIEEGVATDKAISILLADGLLERKRAELLGLIAQLGLYVGISDFPTVLEEDLNNDYSGENEGDNYPVAQLIDANGQPVLEYQLVQDAPAANLTFALTPDTRDKMLELVNVIIFMDLHDEDPEVNRLFRRAGDRYVLSFPEGAAPGLYPAPWELTRPSPFGFDKYWVSMFLSSSAGAWFSQLEEH